MADINHTCTQYGVPIAQLGLGRPRKYCGQLCSGRASAKKLEGRPLQTCSVLGCKSPANRVGMRLCEMHYGRTRRNGTTQFIGGISKGNLIHSRGYVLTPARGHPRALGNYRAYEHRVVFYDSHGEGPFECNWCGCTVTWDGMHVDHLDNNPLNNDPSNLVASCPECNQHRGYDKMRRTMRNKHGVTISGRTMTMNEWASYVGMSRSSIMGRIKRGWTVERAVFTKRGPCGPKSLCKSLIT